MTIDEMIAVLRAAKAGKRIQCQAKFCIGEPKWIDCSPRAHWSFDTDDYRVKPEPREWRVFVSETALHVVEPAAWTEGPTIKVREVLE